MADAFAGTRRRIAYERLLLDLLEGDPTLFVRRDEVEAQWQWIDGVRAAWTAAGMAPRSYAAGNWGPSAATALARRGGGGGRGGRARAGGRRGARGLDRGRDGAAVLRGRQLGTLRRDRVGRARWGELE